MYVFNPSHYINTLFVALHKFKEKKSLSLSITAFYDLALVELLKLTLISGKIESLRQ